MKKFIKIDNYWWELCHYRDGYRCENVNGGGFSIDPEEIAKHTVTEARSMKVLDWSDTLVLNNISHAGWLSPTGEFYGCSFSMHQAQARYVHHKEEEELEEEGWIKLVFLGGGEPTALSFKPITNEQYNYLKKTIFYSEDLQFRRRMELYERDMEE